MDTNRFSILFHPEREPAFGGPPYTVMSLIHKRGGVSVHDALSINEMKLLISEAQNALWDLEAKEPEKDE
jgi:hypothetical protein